METTANGTSILVPEGKQVIFGPLLWSSTLLPMRYILWIFLSHSTLVLSFWHRAPKTSMEYIMKCWVTLAQKGQTYKSFLIGKSLQRKRIEICWLLLFPFTLFPIVICFLWSKASVKHKIQPPSKAQIQTGVLQAQ